MTIANLLKKYPPPPMSANERRRTKVLLVDSEMVVRNAMRQALISLGYQQITDATDHAAALRKMEDQTFTHVIFEAKHINMPPRLFLNSLLEHDRSMITIPSSYTPTLDDVFDLLISGARGFLVKPFNATSLDDAIAWATNGEPISEAILNAKDRNHALAALMLSALDRLALVIRQSAQFETARREMPKRAAIFRRSVEIGRAFCKGGESELTSAVVDSAIEKAQGPAGRAVRGREKVRPRSGRGSPPPQRDEADQSGTESPDTLASSTAEELPETETPSAPRR